MNILTLEFFALVLICRIGAMRLPVRAQNHLILFASLWFCLRHSLTTALFLAWTFLVTDSTFRWYRKSRKKWVSTLGVLIVAATWILSRWLQPVSDSLLLTGVATGLALGLSFYMLQAIAFLLGLGNRETDGDPSRVQLFLYLAYFPKLPAGPIEPPDTFIRQLRKRPRPSAAGTMEGFHLVIGGFFRKSLLGDPLLRSIPPAFFSNPQLLSTTQLVIWLVALMFGIYNDFMGYTQIARGVSRILGISLSRNFRFPFFSRSVSDAWTRWHITLSRWFREFLFFPISRSLARRFPNPRHIIPMLLPPLLVMMLSGLWHGFQIHFLLWGVAVGILIFLERILHSILPPRPVASFPLARRWLKGMGLWSCLVLTLVPFSMAPASSLHFFSALFKGSLLPLPTTPILLLIPLSLFFDWSQQRYGETFQNLPVSRIHHTLIQSQMLLAASIFMLTANPVPFIYQGF